MSRPTDLTPQVQERICKLLERGHYRKVAAEAAGVSYETMRRWMVADAEVFRVFRAAVHESESMAEERLYRIVRNGARKDPRLALEVLARKFPKRWGRRDHVKADVKVEHSLAPKSADEMRAQLQSMLAALPKPEAE